MRLPLIICLLLGVLTLAVYSPACHYGFINFDDNAFVSENPYVR